MDLSQIKDLFPLAAPFVSAIVDTHVKPVLTRMRHDADIAQQTLEVDIDSGIVQYLARAYTRQSYLRTLVFANQQKLLKDLYFPLTLVKKDSTSNKGIKVKGYPNNLLPKYHRVLITDAAGMGKSTIARYLFLCCIESALRIPVFIELRHLSSSYNIYDYLSKEFSSNEVPLDPDVTMALLDQGAFTFFLDGYDEVSPDARADVTKQLQDFILFSATNEFLLTSRPEAALATFADFQAFDIRPLEETEAHSLIRKYAEGKPIASEIITKLKDNSNKAVIEFLTNPLLVSLLYRSYLAKPTIPLRKTTFYRQLYDALFENHDLTKEGAFERKKLSGLDIEDFEIVLRIIGFETFRLGKIEYDRSELVNIINKARLNCPGLTFSSTDFLSDLIHAVPLFTAEGGTVRWNHKSIQEYFASLFICRDTKDQQQAILRKMVGSNDPYRYFNVLDICYDIDYNSFQTSVIYDLLVNIRNHCITSYQGSFDGISNSELDHRRSCTFGLYPILQNSNKINFSSDFEKLIHNEFDLLKRCYLEAFTSFMDYSILQFASSERMLLSLLLGKGDSLMKITYKQHYMTKTTINVDSIGDKLRYVCSGLNLPVFIDDNNKSPWNSPDIFVSITQIISRHLGFNRTFKINEIEKEIRAIEHQSSLRNDLDALISGL